MLGLLDLVTKLELSFSQWLLLKRRELELTQDEVAKALDVSSQTISNWEKGRSVPNLTIGQMKILCNVLRCNLSDIPT